MNTIHTSFWRNPVAPGLDFSKTHYTVHQFEPHFHDHYVIQMMEAGVNKCCCDRKNVQVGIGDFLLINPGEVHTGSSADGQWLSYRTLYPRESFIRKMLGLLGYNTGILPLFNSATVRDPILASLFARVFLEKSNPNEILGFEEAQAAFFARLFQKYSNTPSARLLIAPTAAPNIRLAIDYISAHVDVQISLSDLSTAARLSPYHLIRSFKQKTGLTPGEYQRNLRIERAKTLLTKNIQISEAAQMTGFYDQSHFCRHFKRITGVSPSDFRRF